MNLYRRNYKRNLQLADLLFDRLVTMVRCDGDPNIRYIKLAKNEGPPAANVSDAEIDNTFKKGYSDPHIMLAAAKSDDRSNIQHGIHRDPFWERRRKRSQMCKVKRGLACQQGWGVEDESDGSGSGASDSELAPSKRRCVDADGQRAPAGGGREDG